MLRHSLDYFYTLDSMVALVSQTGQRSSHGLSATGNAALTLVVLIR